MSTPVTKSPIQIPVLRVLLIGLTVIVLITRLVLIARSILDVNLLLAQDPVQADLIPVAHNPIAPLTVAIPVPTHPDQDARTARFRNRAICCGSSCANTLRMAVHNGQIILSLKNERTKS